MGKGMRAGKRPKQGGGNMQKQMAQMQALQGALMDAILAENAARDQEPEGGPNHDKDL